MECPKPIVCAIDGPAIGMGAEFTSMCDVRIATPRARFGWVFVHRGLVPDTGAGTWILPRLIGVQATARLLFSGEIMSAEDMAGVVEHQRVEMQLAPRRRLDLSAPGAVDQQVARDREDPRQWRLRRRCPVTRPAPARTFSAIRSAATSGSPTRRAKYPRTGSR